MSGPEGLTPALPMTTDRPFGQPASTSLSNLQRLNERSRTIFREIVETYLATGDPVGSRNLARQLPMTLSPASVRNVMSDLERLGLIYAPHTSAGRLPTQLHLMEEIRKVKRVLGKALPGAPHEILLVLDANTGQNGLAQVKAFDEALGLTGLVLTKLDGTAKGGVVCAIARERPVPLLFVGVGEGIDDLRPFQAAEFAEALVD